MSRRPYSLRKQWIVAAAFALGATGVALADDNSMSIWSGESYAYFNGGKDFPYGKPDFNKSPSTFRLTNPHGLSNAEYQAVSSDGRPWPLPDLSEATTVASMDAAKAWRQSHPHGLPISVYEAWSADGRPWPLPNAAANNSVASMNAAPATTSASADTVATKIARFFGFFHADRTTSAN